MKQLADFLSYSSPSHVPGLRFSLIELSQSRARSSLCSPVKKYENVYYKKHTEGSYIMCITFVVHGEEKIMGRIWHFN